MMIELRSSSVTLNKYGLLEEEEEEEEEEEKEEEESPCIDWDRYGKQCIRNNLFILSDFVQRDKMVQKNLIKYRRRIRFYCTWLLNSYFMNSFYVVLFLSVYLFIVNTSLYLIIFYQFSINLHITYVLHLVLEISSPDTKAFLCTCYNVCNTSSQEICLLAQPVNFSI